MFLLRIVVLLSSLLLASLVHAAPAGPYRKVEACFVLDTTGSMGPLIDAAKKKIWFIANEIVGAPSKPDVKLCLLAFRDRGDDYVTAHTDLTDDVDTIYAKLNELRADGGGDTPEAVNQALLEAVDATSWSTGDDVLRVIFLVGDAPPHTDYAEPQYPQIAARAFTRGIVINPVLCGEDAEARGVWQRIATAAHGEAAQIAQSAHVERIVTPVDQDLAALNRRLGPLIVPYGDDAERAAVAEKQRLAEKMDDVGVSDRLAFNAATERIVQGGGDLVDALDEKRVAFADVERARLPEAMRSMTDAELHAHVDAVRQKRDELERVIGELVEERRTLVEAKRDKNARGFDATVSGIVRRQIARE